MPRIVSARSRPARRPRTAVRPPDQQGAAGAAARRTRSTISALLVGAITGAVCAGAATVALAVGAVAPGPAQPGWTGTAVSTSTAVTPQTTSATASPTPTSTPTSTSQRAAPSAPPPGRTVSTAVTFYSAGDNDPPGSRAISHPNKRHSQAGGTGTYSDPITMAADPRAIRIGTIAYYPTLRKYFVMEDTCASCVADWSGSRELHIDLWTGATIDDGIAACLLELTPDGAKPVELDAPAGRPFDPTPLYSSGRCNGA